MKNKGHIHAELMAQYAEDAITHAEPWKLWEFKSVDGEWYDCSHHPYWRVAQEFRRKLKTHIVNGVEVPDLRFVPKKGDRFYLPYPLSNKLCSIATYADYESHYHRVSNNLCYEPTAEGKQAAILHAKAWLGI